MPLTNIYSLSDEAIAQTLGQRLEQRRLEANISQQDMAEQLGVTPKTYRNLVQGQGKLVHYIGILRILGELPLADQFIPETPFSPMALLELQGKQRQRASQKRQKPNDDSEELGW